MSDSDLESRASIHLSALHISGSADMALCASRPYDNKTDVADLFSMSRENVFVCLVYVGLSSSPDCPQTLISGSLIGCICDRTLRCVFLFEYPQFEVGTDMFPALVSVPNVYQHLGRLNVRAAVRRGLDNRTSNTIPLPDTTCKSASDVVSRNLDRSNECHGDWGFVAGKCHRRAFRSLQPWLTLSSYLP